MSSSIKDSIKEIERLTATRQSLFKRLGSAVKNIDNPKISEGLERIKTLCEEGKTEEAQKILNGLCE